MMVFNCRNINALNNTTNEDWGVTIAAGGQWATIVRSLRRTETFSRVAMMGWRARGIFTNGEELRNLLHEAYTLYDIDRTGNTPNKLIAIDTPLGTGAEVAVNITSGVVRIS